MRALDHFMLSAQFEEFDELAHYGLDKLRDGKTATLYHGTTASVKRFKRANREDLVKNFYGGGLFLAATWDVAAKYATANRNIGFPPSIVDEYRKKDPVGADLMAKIVKHGYEDGWAAWQKAHELETGQDMEDAVKNDLNDISDVAQRIRGAKADVSTKGGPIDLWGNTVDDLGLDSRKYRPKVYTVKVAPMANVVIADSISQARRARGKADALIWIGSDLVDNVPEVAVFDISKVSIAKIEVV